MKSTVFKLWDPISILSFLRSIKTAFDSSGIHEEAAICLLQYFMKDPAKAALTYRVCTTESDDPSEKES